LIKLLHHGYFNLAPPRGVRGEVYKTADYADRNGKPQMVRRIPIVLNPT
jgi:hypothetical protein